ncbi:putative capsid protein [Avon-Heathcote Estuary associated circular virus 6]|uniref:putative capsid protein n=1 Tax=Avon-Heathcote Estuary associated circular virus 6 TaxID=1618257 RepID=UPI0005CCD975|nr:putative capsid protein [Avon-Heathcote Estuary associated circular virus 6]AJP36365.1 putative capsid protein [Avon-Heathcote Estuary associated circular virus 6]
MPPIRKLDTRAKRAAALRRGQIRAPRRRGAPFRYRTGTKRGRTTAARRNGNTIALTTLSRKQENLSISYREMLEFNDMGGDNGSTPCLIRVNLNNPVIGGATPTGPDTIVSVVGNLKTGATDPTFIPHSYENKRNLSDRLAEYFSIYRTAIVTSAEVTVVCTPKLNQLNGMTGNNRSIVPFTQNRASEDPAVAGQATYLYQHNANAMPQVEVWSIRQQNQGQLTSAAAGSPPLETLKQGIPGMRMTRLNVVPNSTKGVTYKMSYTPKSMYAISDWKDNKKVLKIFNNAVKNPDQKEAYMYVGIAGRFQGLDPVASLANMGLPHFNVEVKVKYNINFSERYNIDGNNEPVPHTEL